MEEKEAQGQEDVEAGTPQDAPSAPATDEPAPAEPSADESDPGVPIEPGK